MAEFGVGITDLGRTGFSGYIKQGVVDKSKAMGIESKYDFATSALGYGMEKIKEYDKYQTLKGTAEEIGVLMQEQEDRSYAGQALLSEETNKLKNEMGLIQDKAGYDQTYPTVLNQQLSDDISGVQNALAEKTDRLTKAREQGAMTEFELETRLSKITREAIARNPALAPEIISHVSTVANLNNLTAKVKQDADIVKAQQDARSERDKVLIKMAQEKDNNLNLASPRYKDPVTGGFDTEALEQDLVRVQRYNEANTLINNQETLLESSLKLSTQKLINSGYLFDIGDARVHLLGVEINSIVDGEGTPGKKEAAIDRAIANNYQQLLKAYNSSGIDISDTTIDKSLAALKSRMDAIGSQYKEVLTNAKDLQILKDDLSLMEFGVKKELYNVKGFLKNLVLGKSLNDATGPYAGIALKDTISSNIIDTISRTKKDFEDEDKIDEVSKSFVIAPGTKKSSYLATGSQFRDAIINLNTDEARQEFSDHIIKGLNFIANPAEANKDGASRDLMKLFSDPRTTPEIVTGLEKDITGSIANVALVHAKGYVQNNLINILNNTQGITLTITNDGTIMALGDNSRPINTKLGGLNDTFKAYHKARNSGSLDKSINEFYAPLGLPLQGATEKK